MAVFERSSQLNVAHILYNGILTLNSTFWMISVYLIKNQWSIWEFPRWVCGIVLLMVPVVFSLGLLKVSKWLSADSLIGCCECMLADNEFLPVYLGYCFVALSAPDDLTMAFVYIIIYTFTYLSQTQYFNPIYLLLGYHYYHALTNQGTRVFIIVPGDVIRNCRDRSFTNLKRMNDTTYLAIKEDISR